MKAKMTFEQARKVARDVIFWGGIECPAKFLKVDIESLYEEKSDTDLFIDWCSRRVEKCLRVNGDIGLDIATSLLASHAITLNREFLEKLINEEI